MAAAMAAAIGGRTMALWPIGGRTIALWPNERKVNNERKAPQTQTED